MMRTALPLMMILLLCGVSACDRDGPAERLGEEIDHAADTVRNGGKEPLRNRVEDAVDELRDE
ncbi:MAG: hypothetical protein AB7I01_23965 [Gammaproteobacteria bacterium]